MQLLLNFLQHFILLFDSFADQLSLTLWSTFLCLGQFIFGKRATLLTFFLMSMICNFPSISLLRFTLLSSCFKPIIVCFCFHILPISMPSILHSLAFLIYDDTLFGHHIKSIIVFVCYGQFFAFWTISTLFKLFTLITCIYFFIFILENFTHLVRTCDWRLWFVCQ